MAQTVVRGLYRTVMATAAISLSTGTRLPTIPEAWRRHRERLGLFTPEERATLSGAPAVWVHAASVGELTAVRPLLAELRARQTGRQLIVSTLTRTGLGLARALSEAHVTTLLPLDAPAIVRATLDAVRLEAFLFTETEIWPTWLEELRRRRIPAIMVSGRVSARTARRARWLRPLYGPALADVTCCMQTAEDAERLVLLGADPRRVQVVGSLKFDVDRVGAPGPGALLGSWLDGQGRRLVVAGSTHEGEEAAVLAAYRAVVARHPDLVLLLAPRHPDRFDAVAALVEASGVPLRRWSEVQADEGRAAVGPLVVLLDEMGPLAACYGLGIVAFVGGTLAPVGGHNVLEPARAGVPVVVGPHTANTQAAVDRLLAAGGATRVESGAGLGEAFERLVREPGLAAAMGQRARRAIEGGDGAIDRHLKVIAARLSAASFARRDES